MFLFDIFSGVCSREFLDPLWRCNTFSAEGDKRLQKQNNDFFTRNEKPDIVPNENRSQVFPRPIKFVPRKQEIIRRDSANYSQTSSQDNSSVISTF
jgi:hypothetical protein